MADRLFIGLSSGCACDGVDAVLASVRGRRERIKGAELHHVHVPFEQDLSGRLLQACLGPADGSKVAASPWADLAQLDRDAGLTLAGAAETLIEAAGTSRADIVAVGATGPTPALVTPVAHRPLGAVLELGSAAVVAAHTRLPVVSGFIASDIAAGGCGSPPGAWCDWRLLRHRRLSRVAVHLGGMASLTFVGSGAGVQDVVACDVGPGTMVIDAVVRKYFDRPFDADGTIASGGRVNAALLDELLAGPYFRKGPPKAAAPARFGRTYLDRLHMMAEKHHCGPKDLVTTVTELTARSVAAAVGALTERPHEVILSGGGGMNIPLAGRIRGLLSPSSTYTVERYGPSLRGMGALSAAMLAAARVDKFTAHCPSATGATRQAVLGSVTMP